MYTWTILIMDSSVFILGGRCYNIPMAADGLPQELMTKQLSSALQADASKSNLSDKI